MMVKAHFLHRVDIGSHLFSHLEIEWLVEILLVEGAGVHWLE